MRLLLNDANILIDIVKLEIVDAFLSLDFDLHTTDFVLAELNDFQQQRITTERLSIIKTESTEDFSSIIELANTHKGLSFEDCSVWYYTQKMNGILITGDGTLRKKALASGIIVKGILYLLDEIKSQNNMSDVEFIEMLQKLIKINDRLPNHVIEKRIQEMLNKP